MIVYPSAGWFLTYSTAIRPPAPGLFSMITGCPMLSDSFCPTRRAKRSLPPAAKPTIKRIGLLGKFAAASPCAPAGCAASATNAANPALSKARFNPIMDSPPPSSLATAFFANRGQRQVHETPPCARDCPTPRFDADARRVLGSRPAAASPPADKLWLAALSRQWPQERQQRLIMAFPTAEQRRHTTRAANDLFGHPRGLTFLFATEMWERFSYYGMRALLVLYMVKLLLLPGHADNVIGLGALRYLFESMSGPLGVQPFSSHIYGLYTGLVYLTPVFGGMLADRVLGQHRTIILGAAMMAIGHFMMAFEPLFLIALTMLILGNGAFKPNMSAQVGGLYAHGDPRRDRAYSIFYVGINLGAFLAPLVCGTLGEELGWHYGFTAAGVG